jgi:hypothetical protein
MAQPIFAIDHINGPQVYRLNFADPTSPGAAIGGPLPIGATFTGAWTPQNYQTNFVIRHGYKIYAYHRTRIWVYDEENPSNDWALLYQFPESFFAGQQALTGLYKMLIDDDPHLVALGSANASSVNIQHVSWNLRTNTLRADGVIPSLGTINNQGFHDVHPWKQFLFFFDSDPGDIKKFHTDTNVVSNVSVDSVLNGNVDSCLFVPWNGRLCMVHHSTSRWRLWEYNEGLDQFEVIHSFQYGVSQVGQNTIRNAAWQQNGFLYVILNTTNAQGGDGFTMWKLSEGTIISEVDLTSSLPVNLRMFPTGSAEPVAWNANQRWTAVVDQESNPANPVTTLYLHEDGTTTTGQLDAYSWSDPTMTSIDTGTAANFITSKEIDGGGSRFWTPGDIIPEVTLVQSTGTTVRMTFKLHGGGVQSLGIWWAFEHDLPTTRGTLTNNSHGSITGGGNNILSGITADGVTEYSVEWRAQFDGIMDLDDVNFMIKPD